MSRQTRGGRGGAEEQKDGQPSNRNQGLAGAEPMEEEVNSGDTNNVPEEPRESTESIRIRELEQLLAEARRATASAISTSNLNPTNTARADAVMRAKGAVPILTSILAVDVKKWVEQLSKGGHQLVGEEILTSLVAPQVRSQLENLLHSLNLGRSLTQGRTWSHSLAAMGAIEMADFLNVEVIKSTVLSNSSTKEDLMNWAITYFTELIRALRGIDWLNVHDVADALTHAAGLNSTQSELVKLALAADPTLERLITEKLELSLVQKLTAIKKLSDLNLERVHIALCEAGEAERLITHSHPPGMAADLTVVSHWPKKLKGILDAVTRYVMTIHGMAHQFVATFSNVNTWSQAPAQSDRKDDTAKTPASKDAAGGGSTWNLAGAKNTGAKSNTGENLNKKPRLNPNPAIFAGGGVVAPIVTTTGLCNHCGTSHVGANTQNCLWRTHSSLGKYWNRTQTTSWPTSASGLLAKQDFPTSADSTTSMKELAKVAGKGGIKPPPTKADPKKGKDDIDEYLYTMTKSDDDITHLIPTHVTNLRKINPDGTESRISQRHQVSALIDTGALDASYVGSHVYEFLQSNNFNVHFNELNKVRIKTAAFDIINSLGSLDIQIKIFNEMNLQWEHIEIKNAIIIESDFDVIVGRPDIRRFNLLQKMGNQIVDRFRAPLIERKDISPKAFLKKDKHMLALLSRQKESDPLGTNLPSVLETCDNENNQRYTTEMLSENAKLNSTNPQNTQIRELLQQIRRRTETQSRILATLRLAGIETVTSSLTTKQQKDIIEEELIKPLDDTLLEGRVSKDSLLQGGHDDNTPEDELITHEAMFRNGTETNDEYLQIPIGPNASEGFKKDVIALLHAYRQYISTVLPIEPARVTPMDIELDESKWKSSKNRLPARITSIVKDFIMGAKIEVMLASGIIVSSDSAEWSQVLLTPKPDLSWRFCIDFRSLNEATSAQGYPLPRIRELIQRIGHKAPKWFAKLDLTSGYHQMPLGRRTQAWTAFTCSKGIYQWTRVPMGLKNAAAYFQKVMTEEVLSGLIQHICELYIDDCIVYASTEKELLSRLKTILQRCKERNIIINPTKCMIAMNEIEILGYTINHEGMTFNPSRLAEVVDIPFPKNGTAMLSFIGIVNHYCDHIKDHTVILQPLRRIAQQYPGKTTIPEAEWTTENVKAFAVVKDAVLALQKLYFIDYNSEVFLHTDASNQGIGAYLFQVIDGKERVIAFLSKALKGAELNWSTFETEGYAIWYALKKFEYLLRDIKFVIRTDHRNLLYVNQAASAKVQRWKWDIQQYNFTVEHIPGRLNIVADGFSRLATLATRKGHGSDNEEQFNIPNKLNVPQRLAAIHTALPLRRVTRSMNQTQAITQNDTEPATEMEIEQPTPIPTPERLVTETEQPEVTKKATLELRPGARKFMRPMTADNRKLIAQVHNTIVGHHKVDRTLDLLKQRSSSTWPGMRADVKQFINECPCCQFMDTAEIKAGISPFNVSAYYPMDRLNIDHIGPLPPDENENTHILVIIDVFSRFVELIPAKSTTAAEFAHALIPYVGRYGHPDEILTDNGPTFIADLTKVLCELLDVEHIKTLAYSHEENSIVERANQEVMKHLRAIIFDKCVHHKWSMYLPLVQRILNVTPKSTTGVAPARVIYGNNVDLDRGIFTKNRQILPNQPIDQYLEEMAIGQARVIAVAQATQAILNAQHISRKTRDEIVSTQIRTNDMVIIIPHRDSRTGKRLRDNKTSPFAKGPYRVTNVQGSRITIQNLLTGKILPEQHILSVKLFRYDHHTVDPKEVAQRAAREYVIEEIIDIRGQLGQNKKSRVYQRTNLELLVRWRGYDESGDTWEPFPKVKTSRAFKIFCETNKYEYLLPKDIDYDESNEELN